jgi:hypothetical protein
VIRDGHPACRLKPASPAIIRPLDAAQAAEAVRQHWGIENKLHYTRDVTRIRSFAYNILRFNQSDIAQDRYAAAIGGLKSLFLGLAPI